MSWLVYFALGSSLIIVSRYCNMDYIVLSTLAGIKLPQVTISYDIGCQWSRNLQRCMEEYPNDMKINPNIVIDVGVPSWLAYQWTR